MMQNPWMSASAQLALGGSRFARFAEQLAAIDKCLRTLLSLPASSEAPKGGPAHRAKLEAACVRMALALNVIWDDYADLVRRSMIEAVAPVSRLGSLSGIGAYVDLGEQALRALRRVRDDGRSAGHKSRVPPLPPTWSHHAYANAVAWARDSLSETLADDIAFHAIQDLVRLSGTQKLTPQQVQERRARKAARTAIFDSEWMLKHDAVSVLELLPNPPTYASYSDMVGDVTFKGRTLRGILAHLCTLGLARNKARIGYCTTKRGARTLRCCAR
jgi:hypothetical protein